MSTILKALRRLEEEKASAEEPRPLREQIANERLIVRPARRGWLAALVALVLGVGTGGGAIWWLFRGESAGTAPPVVARAAPQPVADPVAVAAPPAPPSAIPALAPPAEPDPGPPEQAFASDVEIIPRPSMGPRLTEDAPVEPVVRGPVPGSRRPVESSSAAARARRAAIEEAEAAAAARQAQPIAEPPPVVSHVAEVPTPLPPATEAPVEVRLPPTPPAAAPAPKPAPAVARAAKRKPAVRPPAPPPVAAEEAAAPPPADLPQLEVEKTQWHPLPDRRIAWLRVAGESESRRVAEGDVVDGLVVAKIEPSGVVFERGGEQFHRGLGQR